jgi:hypothetical protein
VLRLVRAKTDETHEAPKPKVTAAPVDIPSDIVPGALRLQLVHERVFDVVSFLGTHTYEQLITKPNGVDIKKMEVS